MKPLLLTVFLAFVLGGPVMGQEELYDAQELDLLVGSVALYPDAMLSNIMAASTFPSQVVRADDEVSSGHPPSSILDRSLRALSDHPDILAMMADNMDWTNALGWAVANQPQDLSDAIQRFRYAARTVGNLESNAQVEVVEEGAVIRIELADPDRIFVPIYDPELADQDTVEELCVWGTGALCSPMLWSTVYDWHQSRWWHPPEGWRPDVRWATPYGWRDQSARFQRWSPNPDRVYSRPATIVNPGNLNRARAQYRGNSSRRVSAYQRTRRDTRHRRNANPSRIVLRQSSGGTLAPRARDTVSNSRGRRGARAENRRSRATNRGRNAQTPAPKQIYSAIDYQGAGQASRQSTRGNRSRGMPRMGGFRLR